MEIANLDAEVRKLKGKNQVKKIKAQGLIPAVIYGLKKEPITIKINKKSLHQAYKGEYGANILIKMNVKDGDKSSEEMVITHVRDRDCITLDPLHIDFLRIDMDSLIQTKVRVELKGVSPGVKAGGLLIHKLHFILVECLPNDIPAKVVIDISTLDLGDHVSIKDLELGDKVKPIQDELETIVRIASPKGKTAEEEEEAAEGAEDGEGAEGDEAPTAEGEGSEKAETTE